MPRIILPSCPGFKNRLVSLGVCILNDNVSLGRAMVTVCPAIGKAVPLISLKSLDVITIEVQVPVPENIIGDVTGYPAPDIISPASNSAGGVISNSVTAYGAFMIDSFPYVPIAS